MQNSDVMSPSSRRFLVAIVGTVVAQLALIAWALGPW